MDLNGAATIGEDCIIHRTTYAGIIRCVHVFASKLERFFLRVGMTENKIEGKRGIGSYLSNETGLVLVVSAASYVFAYASQRAYLKAFGIDEAFVTVGLEDVVRSGVWLLVFVFVWLLQMPCKLISKLFLAIVTFLTLVTLFVFLTFLYIVAGVTWITAIFGLLFVLAFCFEIFLAGHFLWKGGTWDEYFQRRIETEKQVIEAKVDQKFSDIFGSNTWSLILFLMVAPYGVGVIVSDREAKRKSEFLQFSDADENYIIVHEASGTFVAVGYEDRGTEPAILNSHVKVLLSGSLSELALENRKFGRGGLLLSEPEKLQSVKEWYQNDFAPLFKSDS